MGKKVNQELFLPSLTYYVVVSEVLEGLWRYRETSWRKLTQRERYWSSRIYLSVSFSGHYVLTIQNTLEQQVLPQLT